MIDHLHSLLRAELSAVAGYQRALAFLRRRAAEDGDDLLKLASDHQRTAAVLQESIQARGGVADAARSWEGPAALPVDEPVERLESRQLVASLHEAERLLLAEYERRGASLDEDARDLVERELIPRQRRHVEALSARLALLPK